MSNKDDQLFPSPHITQPIPHLYFLDVKTYPFIVGPFLGSSFSNTKPSACNRFISALISLTSKAI